VAPNYQVQRPATARLARGRGSARVRVDAERPRLALYASPVRCNAELGGRSPRFLGTSGILQKLKRLTGVHLGLDEEYV
jgi:hypothetical protein